MALHGHENDVEWIKTHFSELVESIQIGAYEAYLSAESEIGHETLRTAFSELVPPTAERNETIETISRCFPALDRFFLGLTQSRRPRAGKAFEVLMRELFVRLNYPHSSQPIINGQPDFVLPSRDHFVANAMDSVIFTVKRTLRERWRQIISEGTRGLGFFLATIDEEIGERDLREMLISRIHIVVPARVKVVREDYAAASNVITFEAFFRDHLDPAMARWRANGVIR